MTCYPLTHSRPDTLRRARPKVRRAPVRLVGREILYEWPATSHLSPRPLLTRMNGGVVTRKVGLMDRVVPEVELEGPSRKTTGFTLSQRVDTNVFPLGMKSKQLQLRGKTHTSGPITKQRSFVLNFCFCCGTIRYAIT